MKEDFKVTKRVKLVDLLLSKSSKRDYTIVIVDG